MKLLALDPGATRTGWAVFGDYAHERIASVKGFCPS